MLPKNERIESAPPSRNLVYAWNGVVMYVAGEHLNKTHAHFPALLQISLGSPFAVSINDQPPGYHDIVVMAPNLNHSTDSGNQPYLAILIDPDHDLYRYLHPLLDGHCLQALAAAYLSYLQPRFKQLVAGQLSIGEAEKLLKAILSSLCPEPLLELPWDARVLHACHYIQQLIPQQAPTAAQVAAQVKLSESRLMHLFSEQLGIFMRQYILWLRVRYAIKLWLTGSSITDIALEAGFSDQAHFTRTLRRAIDFSPALLKANTLVLGDL